MGCGTSRDAVTVGPLRGISDELADGKMQAVHDYRDPDKVRARLHAARGALRKSGRDDVFGDSFASHPDTAPRSPCTRNSKRASVQTITSVAPAISSRATVMPFSLPLHTDKHGFWGIKQKSPVERRAQSVADAQ